MLGPFHDNSGDVKEGEESKQSTNLRSFPNLGDTVLTITPATLGTDNP